MASTSKENSCNSVEELARNAVLVHSISITPSESTVKGYDFNNGLDYHEILKAMRFSGFQATNFGLAVEEIKQMLNQRDIPLIEDQIDSLEEDEFIKRKYSCTIFLGYTSNMVDCIVTTAGGVEEDLIKCLAPTYLGKFSYDGKLLREKGLNRIGNLIVPNDNYCLFEDWVMPILDAMLAEQIKQGTLWTPSKIITKLGEEINNEESIYYWAAKNKIPVFCPALTDGSFGDMMFFHSFKNPGLVVDILADLKRLNTISLKAVTSGMVIIGGGVIKHHICNANLMRNGADFAVFLNTSSEFDGSDSGARPDEAISWGKIRKNANPVKVTILPINTEFTIYYRVLVEISDDIALFYFSPPALAGSDIAAVEEVVVLLLVVVLLVGMNDDGCGGNQHSIYRELLAKTLQSRRRLYFHQMHNKCFYFSVKREPKEEPSSPLEATSPGSILRNNGEFILKSNYAYRLCELLDKVE
ncbi:Probable deoxyhypusine synthase [Harpegnathos saltator]|uniref:deoxyhypusine synthase n=1 Tax=Harpegnathos saltator TaxID=610380 RepID=E2BUP7_HARSA|nr:Probable deoxyhypusine synthase [Harpegnathos saltator]